MTLRARLDKLERRQPPVTWEIWDQQADGTFVNHATKEVLSDAELTRRDAHIIRVCYEPRQPWGTPWFREAEQLS